MDLAAVVAPSARAGQLVTKAELCCLLQRAGLTAKDAYRNVNDYFSFADRTNSHAVDVLGVCVCRP